MSSSNAVCASRFFSRGWEGSRRIIAFDVIGYPGGRFRRNAFCRSIDAQKTRFFFGKKKIAKARDEIHASASSPRSSESSKSPYEASPSSSEEAGVSVAARRKVLWPMGRGAGCARASRSCERRGRTRSDGSRMNSLRRISVETWHPFVTTRDPPNERAAARDARARGGRSPRDAGSARGGVPATPRGGKTPARAAAYRARQRQSTMNSASGSPDIVDHDSSISLSFSAKDLEHGDFDVLVIRGVRAKGTRHDAAAVELDRRTRRSRGAPARVGGDPAGLRVQRRVGRVVGPGDVFDR